jgi:AraC-like DNA-binding protein
MPFAPQIRKQMLQALDEYIIPQLSTQVVLQVLAGPPYDFSQVAHSVVREKPLPDRDLNSLDVFIRWEKEGLVARRMSQLAFAYMGASDERVGLTRQMSKQLNAAQVSPLPAGVTSFRLSSPAAFYVPMLVPHTGNTSKESLGRTIDPLRMLVLQFTRHELLLRHFESDRGGTHHLNITDPYFVEMEQVYVGLLAQGNKVAAQSQLLTLMRRVSDYIRYHPVPVSNSSWPSLNGRIRDDVSLSTQSARLCYQAIDYIQFHLHKPLTGTLLAEVCGVTYMHLNRVFHEVTGLSVMRFVTESRLIAAKHMLVDTQERISDIARIVGFSSMHSFSVVFTRHVGVCPSEYRRNGGTS